MTPPEREQRPTKVVYLLGWGRSGSTLLDNLLGAVEGVFSAGELRFLWQRGLVDGRTCGCGRAVTDCPVWVPVLERTFPDGPPDVPALLELQARCARFRHVARLSTLRADRLPAYVAAYTGVLARLYRAIADVTGDGIVVDSSKWPTDVALLRLTPGVDVHVVHLVRDPRAVAYSWQRVKAQPDKPAGATMHRVGPLASSTRWLAWNGAAELLRHRLPADRWLTVRYEDFVQQPRTTVAAITAMLGLPAATVLPFSSERVAELPGNHTVAGNPSRFRTGEIELRADDEWRTSQPGRQRALSTFPALPLLHRYRYPVRLPRD